MLGIGIKLAAALGFAGAIALSIAPAEAQTARKKTDQSVVSSGPATHPSAMRRSYGSDQRGSNYDAFLDCQRYGGPG
jgi:hypothetical protein